jgi:hypothetical protein
MGHTLPSRKLMENRTSWDPDKLPPILVLIWSRSVACVVVVLFLNGHRICELFGIGGDGVGMSVRWNRDYTFFTCDDEVTKVSPVYAVESIFLPLIKR